MGWQLGTPIPGNGLYVGGSNTGQAFTGSLDEVAIYPTALTSAQIGTHYQAAKSPPPPPTSLSFTWAMQSRFGRDPQGSTLYPSGIPLYPSDINPATFQVNFDACASKGSATTFIWRFADGAKDTRKDCHESHKLRRGSQTVTVAGFAATGNWTGSYSQSVDPHDLLIVSIGDSIASGEGNPDIPGQCDDSPLTLQNLIPINNNPFDTMIKDCHTPPLWRPQYPTPGGGPQSSTGYGSNRQCHRSTIAGPAQAALQLESRDPHTSVTFLHVACSGASIGQGLLGDYGGIESAPGDQPIIPQLEQVKKLTLGRSIDALFVTIGANNIGFSSIVTQCLAWASPPAGF
jgi:hypothetical protein